MVRVIKGEEQILHHLSEPEALGVVDKVVCVWSLLRVADVPDTCKPGRRAEERLEALDGRGCTVEVLGVARNTPGVEVTLQHLWTLQVVGGAGLNEEPILFVERKVICGNLLVRDIALV